MASCIPASALLHRNSPRASSNTSTWRVRIRSSTVFRCTRRACAWARSWPTRSCASALSTISTWCSRSRTPAVPPRWNWPTTWASSSAKASSRTATSAAPSSCPARRRARSRYAKLNAIELEFRGKNVMLVDDSIVRGTTCKQIIQMAREAGAKNVYFCSAAPAVRYPNVYGIDMPSAHELIAHNRTTQDVADLIGADWLIYQDLSDLIEAVGGGKVKIEQFDCAVFDGKYVTGDIDEHYLAKIEQARNDASKVKTQAVSAIIDLYNN